MPRSSLPADFTGDSSFHLDDIRRAGESKAPQNSLPALQLIHLQNGPSFLQLSLGRANIRSNLRHTPIVRPCNHCSESCRRSSSRISEKIISNSWFVNEVISDTITVMEYCNYLPSDIPLPANLSSLILPILSFTPQ